MPSLNQKHAHVKGQRSNYFLFKFQPNSSWAKKGQTVTRPLVLFKNNNYENRLLVEILVEYYTLFLSKIRKEVTIFVLCCSCDWRFKGFI